MSKRPVCAVSLLLILLTALLSISGLTNDTALLRRKLTQSSRMPAEWSDITLRCRISSIARKEERTVLTADHLEIIPFGYGIPSGHAESTAILSDAFICSANQIDSYHYNTYKSHSQKSNFSKTNSFITNFSKTNSYTSNFELLSLYHYINSIQLPFFYRAQIYLSEEDTALACGNEVLIKGLLSYPEKPRCPGQFDALQYADAGRILLQVMKAQTVSIKRRRDLRSAAEAVRSCITNAFYAVLDESDAALLTGIILGDRSGLTQSQKDLFQEGGISHMFAVSGLHVGLLAMSVYKVLRKRRRSFVTCSLISGTLLVWYCFLTGMSRSSQRAAVMFIVWTGAQITGRSNDMLSAAGLAAVILLMQNTAGLYDAGFQMSFGCILSVILLAPFFQKLLGCDNMEGWKKAVLEMPASSLAISIGTLPVSCFHYYQFSPYAPLLNLLVLPTMSILVVSGIAGAFAGCLCTQAGIFAAAPCHYLLRLYTFACKLVRQLPGSVLVTGRPQPALIVCYYAVIALLVRCEMRKYKKILLLASVVILLVRYRPDGDRVVFLDVGQGDCIVLMEGSSACIVDGGSSSAGDVWNYRLEPCLKYYGISTVEAWFATHGDQDHINGIETCIEEYDTNLIGKGCSGLTIKRFIVSVKVQRDETLCRLTEAWKEKKTPVYEADAGAMMTLRRFRLHVLYPTSETTFEESNENSLVLLAERNNGERILLTGDMEKEEEHAFAKTYRNIGRVDWLKAGHHGSKYATTDELLEIIRPAGVIVSCGEKNRYGHPAQEVLERLGRIGARLYRTDLQGSVILDSSGCQTYLE